MTVKFPDGLKYARARFDNDGVSLYYDRCAWYIRGFGIVDGTTYIRSYRFLLNSGSEITYLDRIWKYGEFGKLATEIERVKLERALEAL